jgi:hypothetical protein
MAFPPTSTPIREHLLLIHPETSECMLETQIRWPLSTTAILDSVRVKQTLKTLLVQLNSILRNLLLD